MGPEEEKEELSIMEALNNLSSMVEADLKKGEISDEEEPSGEINWRDPRQALKNQPAIKETFRVLHRYLQNMVRKDQNTLEDPEILKGINAIMYLAAEAVSKMDRFAALYPKEYKPVSHLKEYTDLQKYYHQHILHGAKSPREIPEKWEEDVLTQEFEIERQGLEDLEQVRTDQNYELFFIKNEIGQPFFSPSLLRHIRLMGNFDELITKVEEEDLLIKMREFFDDEICTGAEEALKIAAPYIDAFYKEGMQHKDRAFISALSKALMALRMAANSKNLIENESYKSCLEYYKDFHQFLRSSMTSPDYLRWLSGELEMTPFFQAVLNLTHTLCFAFFMRLEPVKKGLVWVKKMIARGEEMKKNITPEEKEDSGLSTFLTWDGNLRFLLKHFPNGPILKTLDAFREDEEYEGFDPLSQSNFPSQLFSFSGDSLHVTMMRIPCPTQQTQINKADVVLEFSGFLRYYKHMLKPDKHLIVNLQDRTSSIDYARCLALEDLSKRAEFHQNLFILGLAKKTPFALQIEPYEALGGSEVFIEQFIDHMKSGEQAGYFFPEELSEQKLKGFTSSALKFIHIQFFEGKDSLTQIERKCFIDIFYILLTLKAIELLGVDSVSFVSKDGLDSAVSEAAMLYAFLQLTNPHFRWSERIKDELLWILYTPALFVRDRAIHEEEFARAIHVLEILNQAFHTNRDQVNSALKPLYSKLQFPINILGSNKE